MMLSATFLTWPKRIHYNIVSYLKCHSSVGVTSALHFRLNKIRKTTWNTSEIDTLALSHVFLVLLACANRYICSKGEMNYVEVELEDYKNISNHDELTKSQQKHPPPCVNARGILHLSAFCVVVEGGKDSRKDQRLR